MSKPIVVVVPGQELCRDILSESAKAKLESFAAPLWNTGEKPLTAEQLQERLPGAWGLLTSWGVPKFTEEMLASADQLVIVGHAAGSVRAMFPIVANHGITVVNAAATIADSVAEFTLLMMLALLRNYQPMNAQLKAGERWPTRANIRELYGKRVGLVSASMVGRRVLRLLEPFHCQVIVYDPYLPQSAAQEMGVELASLEELMSTCDVISVHAPVTDETIGMISAQHVRMIRDGAVLVNNARAVVMDYDALLQELQTGRFSAALDVFPQEPLAEDSPFRKLDNVILTPHMAGWATESRLRLAATVIDDMERFLQGKPLLNWVNPDKIKILA